MSLDSGAVLDALVTMLGSVSGVQRVYRGAPMSLTNTLCAWVALGGHTIASEEFEVEDTQLEREARFYVAFGYRVSGDESTAEDALADAVDDFELTFYQDRLAGSGVFASGTGVRDGGLSATLADAPEYWALAGQENRIYPMLIAVTQRDAE